MRFAVAALCVLALTGSAEARPLGYLWACEQLDAIPVQFRQKPTVDWHVYAMPLDKVRAQCADDRFLACAIKVTDDRWKILIDKRIVGKERDCVVQYELAHLPPNFWGDPKVETRAMMQRLAKQRAAYFPSSN